MISHGIDVEELTGRVKTQLDLHSRDKKKSANAPGRQQKVENATKDGRKIINGKKDIAGFLEINQNVTGLPGDFS